VASSDVVSAVALSSSTAASIRGGWKPRQPPWSLGGVAEGPIRRRWRPDQVSANGVVLAPLCRNALHLAIDGLW